MPGGRPDAPTTCAPPYMQMTTGCYRFVSTQTTWLAAERDCEADTVDAHLVLIDSVEEHTVIHDLSTARGAFDVWVGYTDQVAEGSMRWIAPGGLDPVATSFCFFGTATNSDAFDCVTQDAANMCPDWRYRACGDLHAYVCERDGAAPDPTAY